MNVPTQINPSLSQWLQEKGYNPSDLNQRGYNQDTALMTATKEKNISLVRELISAGADVNCKNNDGNNALWYACFKHDLDLINELVNAQIDIDNQNENGVTCLMYASSSGKAEIVRQLLQLGANPRLKNLDDFTAKDFANTVDILRMLK